MVTLIAFVAGTVWGMGITTTGAYTMWSGPWWLLYFGWPVIFFLEWREARRERE